MDSPPCHTQLNDYRIGKGAAEHSSDAQMYHIQSYCMTVIYFLFLSVLKVVTFLLVLFNKPSNSS